MYKYKITPRPYQQSGIELFLQNPYFGLFDEMGVGKSKVVVDSQNLLFLKEKITAVIVVCPNGVKGQWADPERGQIVTHSPDSFPYCIVKVETQKKNWMVRDIRTPHKLLWVVVNYEATRIGRIQTNLCDIVNNHATTVVLDESIYIKNYRSLQTKACMFFSRNAKRRHCLNGTPIDNNYLDYFSQFTFMHPSILGFDKFISFRNRYAVMGGHMVNNRPVQVVGWQNIDELKRKIAPFYRRVTKKEALDLPEKVYQTLEITMDKETEKAYNSMLHNLVVYIDKQIYQANIILTKLLRLSQISSGFISQKDDVTGQDTVTRLHAHKIKPMLDIVEENSGSTVLFCHFKPEIQVICEALEKAKVPYGQIHGGVKNDKREEYIRKFQNNELKVMVCQLQTGGLGIELSAASVVIYMSNPFRWSIRSQSEDRVHRIGVKNCVTYYDFLSVRSNGRKTIDHKIIDIVRNKKDIAEEALNLDNVKELVDGLE